MATMLTLRFEDNESRTILYTLGWRPAHHVVFRFDLRLAQIKAWNSGRQNNETVLYGSMPTDCLVKAVKRNLDDRECEFLYAEEQPGDREIHRIILKKSASKMDKISLCNEKISMKLKPGTDQRYDAASEAAGEQDEGQQSLVFYW